MKRLVLKFGGTSVGTIEKIKNVANIIKKRHNEGNEIIVIVSAMSNVTNDLKKQSSVISKNLMIKNWMYYFRQVNRFQAHFYQAQL